MLFLNLVSKIAWRALDQKPEALQDKILCLHKKVILLDLPDTVLTNVLLMEILTVQHCKLKS